MSRDDIDFDKLFDEELPFKPLTKGLGFHHESKTEKESLGTLKARSKDLERSLSDRAAAIQRTKQSSPSLEKNMGDLAPFYQEKEKKPIQPNLSDEPEGIAGKEVSAATKVDSAGVLPRLSAFLIDMAIIASAMAVTFLSILISSGLSFMVVRENLSLEFVATTVAPISVLFYFFYFSFFDKTMFSTPGKKLMGLRVVSETSEAVKMSQSFLRSLISLASFGSAGLLSALDFQSKLTETKVVRK